MLLQMKKQSESIENEYFILSDCCQKKLNNS